MLAARGSRIERLQQTTPEMGVDTVPSDRRAASIRKATTEQCESQRELEFRFKLDRIALTQLKKLVAARTKEVQGQNQRGRGQNRENWERLGNRLQSDAFKHVVPGWLDDW